MGGGGCRLVWKAQGEGWRRVAVRRWLRDRGSCCDVVGLGRVVGASCDVAVVVDEVAVVACGIVAWLPAGWGWFEEVGELLGAGEGGELAGFG